MWRREPWVQKYRIKHSSRGIVEPSLERAAWHCIWKHDSLDQAGHQAAEHRSPQSNDREATERVSTCLLPYSCMVASTQFVNDLELLNYFAFDINVRKKLRNLYPFILWWYFNTHLCIADKTVDFSMWGYFLLSKQKNFSAEESSWTSISGKSPWESGI